MLSYFQRVLSESSIFSFDEHITRTGSTEDIQMESISSQPARGGARVIRDNRVRTTRRVGPGGVVIVESSASQVAAVVGGSAIAAGAAKSSINHAVLAEMNVMDKQDTYVPSKIGQDFTQNRFVPASIKTPEAPANLQFAQHVGMKMLPYIMFPAFPPIMDTIWVILELMVFIYYLVVNAIYVDSSGLSIFMLSFSAVVVALVLFDAYLHFIENGACFAVLNKLLRFLSKNYKENTACKEPNVCQLLTKGISGFLKTWIQPIRTFLSEIIVYIIIMTELVQTILFDTYNGTDAESRIKFGNLILFLVYFGLSVYLVRLVMALRALVVIIALRKTTSNNYMYFFFVWATNLVLQMIVSGIAIAAAGTKILSENCVPCADGVYPTPIATPSINYTGFLLYVMIAGGILAPFGSILFFLSYYPWMRVVSMALFVDVVSDIKEGDNNMEDSCDDPDTASLKQKALGIVQKIDVSKMRDAYEKFQKRFHFGHTIAYWVSNPLFLIPTIFFVCLSVAVFVSQAYGYIDACVTDTFQSVLTENIPVTVIFFLLIGFVTIANYIPFSVVLGIIAFIIAIPLVLLLIPFYLLLF